MERATQLTRNGIRDGTGENCGTGDGTDEITMNPHGTIVYMERTHEKNTEQSRINVEQ